MTQAAIATDRSSVLESLRTVLAAPLRRQTYKNITYLALAAVLGQLYFVGFVTGASLGVGLLITLLGLPILVGTLAATTGVASLEARVAGWLVGVDIPEPAFISKTSIRDGLVLPGDGFLDAVVSLVTARSTWLSVGLVAVKFVFRGTLDCGAAERWPNGGCSGSMTVGTIAVNTRERRLHMPVTSTP